MANEGLCAVQGSQNSALAFSGRNANAGQAGARRSYENEQKPHDRDKHLDLLPQSDDLGSEFDDISSRVLYRDDSGRASRIQECRVDFGMPSPGNKETLPDSTIASRIRWSCFRRRAADTCLNYHVFGGLT